MTSDLNDSPAAISRLRVLFALVLVGLCIQLLIPRSRQPYPAMLLPGGASIHVHTPGRLEFGRTEVLACEPEGTCEVVQVREILANYDDSLHGSIVRREFGLRKVGMSPGRTFIFGPVKPTLRSDKTTELEAAETRVWLRTRLEEITGRPITRMHLVESRYEWSPDSGALPQLVDRITKSTYEL